MRTRIRDLFVARLQIMGLARLQLAGITVAIDGDRFHIRTPHLLSFDLADRDSTIPLPAGRASFPGWKLAGLRCSGAVSLGFDQHLL